MLRHVISNLRRQDWMAVAIELVIVILGVFIGIQVSNWNQARADVQLGQDYAKRLARDLNTNLAGVRAESAYYSAVLQSVRKTDALLREPDSDPRELVVNAYRATESIYNPPVRATWDQIVSSGHLGLLPARAVESGLSQYFAFDTAQDLYKTGRASDYRRPCGKSSRWTCRSPCTRPAATCGTGTAISSGSSNAANSRPIPRPSRQLPLRFAAIRASPRPCAISTALPSMQRSTSAACKAPSRMHATHWAPGRNLRQRRRPTPRARLLRQGDDSMLRHVIVHLRRQDWMAVIIEPGLAEQKP